MSETFGLVEEGVAWFGPDDVTLELLGTDGEDDPGDDGRPDPRDGVGDGDDEVGNSALLGACSTGGSAPPLWTAVWIALALSASLRTRRRARCRSGPRSGSVGRRGS